MLPLDSSFNNIPHWELLTEITKLNIMKRKIVFGLLFLVSICSYSQNLDLVVTVSGDSVACKIDSISESSIYLQIKTAGNDKWIQTIYSKEDIYHFKYREIDPSKYTFKEGTSKIIGPVQPVYPKKFPDKMTLKNASNEGLDFYLVKAKQTKKKGAIMSIAGPLAATAGGLLFYATFSFSGDNVMAGTGALIMLTGIVTTFVGIPIIITGTSRVKNINEIKRSRVMTMELTPVGNYNFQANNYQPGITLRIRF